VSGTRRASRLASGIITVLVLAGCAAPIGGSAEPLATGVISPSVSPLQTSTVSTTHSEPPTVPAPSPAAPGSGAATTGGSSATSTSGAPGSSVPGSSGASTTAYPTTPADLIKTPRDAAGAALLEGRRIATSLVVPTFIEPTLTGGSISTLPYSGPKAMTILFGPAPMPTVAARAGMITGFSSSRSDSKGNDLIVAAFEFSSAAAAKTAAPLLAAAAADKAADKGKASVPGLPGASGWYGAFPKGYGYYQAFLAQGSMVLYIWVTGPRFNTAALGAAEVAKTFPIEMAAMAKYVPTAPDKLMSLPIDQDGIEAHTLLNTDANGTVTDGVMSGAGQLHYDTDPVGTQKLFAAAGVDLVADGRASVYRAKDAGGAAIVRDGFVAVTQQGTSGMNPYTLTAAVPGASCLQQALDSKYYCVGVAGRYAFEIAADSTADLNAAMLAQYTILKGF
jgi:hypothetical protein